MSSSRSMASAGSPVYLLYFVIFMRSFLVQHAS
jgi:hypothetical protein